MANVGIRRARTRRSLVVASGLVSIAVLAGCSSLTGNGNEGAAAPPPATPSSTPSATLSPTPSPTPVPVSPLSGLPGGLNQPILAVKIDNLVDARPHVGIQSADLVYVEEVEGGLTRIMALFNTKYPTKIGPVRSARISDIDILAPFNHVLLAYSGAQMKLYPLIWASPIIDVGANRGSNAYTRDPSRYAPHNFFGNGPMLVADGLKKHPTLAHDMGWVFSSTTPAGGIPTTSVKAWWPAGTASAHWSPAYNKWIIWFDGKPEMDVAAGHAVRASTVIVQYVQQNNSQFHDHWGGITPYIHSIGSGKAIFFRDGKRWVGEWSRPTATSPTTYTVNGQVFPFAVGPQWVFLVKNDRLVALTPVIKPTPKATASAAPSNATDTHASPKAGTTVN